MILGIGADLCHVERIRRSLRRFRDPWIDHLFTEDERRLCSSHPDPSLLFARGFCGKEACAKALGTGVAEGIKWREIEVLHAASSATLRLSGEAQHRLATMTPVHHRASVMISCAGDDRLAQAFVVAFAMPIQSEKLSAFA